MTINDWLGWVTVVFGQFSWDTAAQTVIVLFIAFLALRWILGRRGGE